MPPPPVMRLSVIVAVEPDSMSSPNSLSVEDQVAEGGRPTIDDDRGLGAGEGQPADIGLRVVEQERVRPFELLDAARRGEVDRRPVLGSA